MSERRSGFPFLVLYAVTSFLLSAKPGSVRSVGLVALAEGAERWERSRFRGLGSAGVVLRLLLRLGAYWCGGTSFETNIGP